MSVDFLKSCDVLDATENVESYLRAHFLKRSVQVKSLSPPLLESMEYSLFSGGKRFRPALCLMTYSQATPLAAAIELVHTYSLIHDDLPCMDNDDERRGRPTNHKKFGEALALLAGDALLTESFFLLATAYKERPVVANELVQLLAQAAGMSGMVGGQAMDMNLGEPISDLAAVEKIHLSKTAELIAVATEGAAIVEGASSEIRMCLKEIGLKLGLCFQIKDDLLDGEQDQSPKSCLHFLSREQTEAFLARTSAAGLKQLAQLPKSYQKISEFFRYNDLRTH
jgi:geranylgeranyl diphosphate synthase, type II